MKYKLLSWHFNLTFECTSENSDFFLQAGAAPLPCNDPKDKYLYELVVYTGTRNNAGIVLI